MIQIEIEMIVCYENIKIVDEKNEINVFFVIKKGGGGLNLLYLFLCHQKKLSLGFI